MNPLLLGIGIGLWAGSNNDASTCHCPPPTPYVDDGGWKPAYTPEQIAQHEKLLALQVKAYDRHMHQQRRAKAWAAFRLKWIDLPLTCGLLLLMACAMFAPHLLGR